MSKVHIHVHTGDAVVSAFKDGAAASDIARAKALTAEINRLLDNKAQMESIDASDLQSALGGLRTALNWIN